MTRLQVKTLSRAPLLLALPVAGLLGNAAVARAADSARDAACFEVIRPHPQTHPRVPLLLDRCTGATWLLVRGESRGPLGYRWAPLDAPPTVQTTKSDIGNVVPKVGETQAPPTANCFVFAGRRYCQ